MCGLAGIVDITGERAVSPRLLAAMTETLVHRGPDGHGLYFGTGVGLGHRRLSIIDIEGGHQPFLSPDERIALVFNGEIYNFQALRRTLKAAGHHFRTHSDTEVILEAWRHWGPACVEHLSGMFAFALWDADSDTLFLARDRLGKKPLYYAELPDGRLVFGSELKALLVYPDVPREIDPTAIEDYFAYNYIPDPKTIYTGVRKLPPAHAMVLRRGEPPRLKRYWDPHPATDGPGELGDALDAFNGLLSEATRLRMIADVPLGAFLSGGVDSSGIVATMAGLSARPVNTFSIAFADKSVDESRYAAMVAERYGTHHTRWQVDPEEFDLLDRLVDIYDEPFGDSSALPTFRVCAQARKGVTVAVSGDGGDEMFAGYRRYLWHQREEKLKAALPAGLRRGLFGALGALYPKMDWAPRALRAKTTLQELAMDEAEAYFLSVSALSDGMRRRIFSDNLRTDLQGYHAKTVLAEALSAADTDCPVARAQYADLKTWLPGDILTKVDRASMASSLEVRSPLLDHEIAEWAMRLPESLRLKGGEKKYLLKKAFEPLLPHDLIYRPKQGFSLPLAAWFRGPLKERAEAAFTSRYLAETGYFDMAALQELFEEHVAGRRDHSVPLWSVLMFESFMRREMAGAEAPERDAAGA